MSPARQRERLSSGARLLAFLVGIRNVEFEFEFDLTQDMADKLGSFVEYVRDLMKPRSRKFENLYLPHVNAKLSLFLTELHSVGIGVWGDEDWSSKDQSGMLVFQRIARRVSEPRIEQGPVFSGHPGRPRKYDWDAMYVEIIRFVNERKGLPKHQSDMEAHARGWFQKQDLYPPESDLRRRIREIYRANAKRDC